LIDEFAKRWNYALPSYPPEGFDYTQSLKTKKLHLVTAQEFTRLKFEESKSDKKKKSSVPDGF